MKPIGRGKYAILYEQEEGGKNKILPLKLKKNRPIVYIDNNLIQNIIKQERTKRNG